MMFCRSIHKVYFVCSTHLACTTMALHPGRSHDDLPTVFSGVEQDMRNATALYQQLQYKPHFFKSI